MSTTISVTDQLPHSTEAEQAVIASLIIDDDAIYNVIPKLQANDFYDPTYKLLYQTMRQMFEEGIAINFVTLTDRLRDASALDKIGGPPFLAQITENLPVAPGLDSFTTIVREKSRRRQLATLGRRIAELVQENSKTADELTDIAEQEFLKLSGEGTHTDPVLLSAMRPERFDHYVSLYENKGSNLKGLQTGFHDLDALLTPFAPGELVILAARPGMGKSVMALDIARHVAREQKKGVAFFSLEMSKEQVFDRLFAADLGVEASKLATGNLTEQHVEHMGSTFDQLSYPLYIDDDFNSDLVHLRSKARRHQMQHGLDLLIVDYLGLIEVTDRLAGDTQYQRVTYISKSLKRLARELHCPVLALSQLSRECERRTDKRPLLSDLRDSGSVEQDGDKILMLYREGEYDEDAEYPDETDVFIRKHRNGATGAVTLKFDRQHMTFRDLDATN